MTCPTKMNSATDLDVTLTCGAKAAVPSQFAIRITLFSQLEESSELTQT